MKILEKLVLDCQEIEVETSKFCWTYIGDPYDFEEVNLETMETDTLEISAPKDHIYWFTCICSLPGNKFFCYRGPTRKYKLYGIAFIIDEDHNIQALPSKIFAHGYCATFYNNFVYMFGDDSILRYNLTKKRWQKLTKTPGCNNLSTCISLSNVILITGYYSTYLFIFDLRACSFSSCSLNLGQDVTKVLCRSGNVAYLIDFSGLILESDKNNFYAWSFIGSCILFNYSTISIKVFYKNSWYFNIDNAIMKFNLDTKSVERTNASISYDNPFD